MARDNKNKGRGADRGDKKQQAKGRQKQNSRRSGGPGEVRSKDERTAGRMDYERPRERRDDRLEGRHAVEEALKADQAIDKVWVMLGENGEVPGPLQPLVRQAKAAGAVIVEAPKQSLDRLTETGTHQGIIAQIPAVEYAEVEDMLALAEEKGEEPFLILLDQIHDSHNLGAILRVADGAGAHGVIIPKHRALGVDAIAVRASAGAASHVLTARVTNLSQAMRELKEKGIWIAGTAAGGENALASNQLRGPIALVIGNEADGMSHLVTETCDFIVSLPMHGAIESLNASVACGILAFRVRQIRDSAD